MGLKGELREDRLFLEEYKERFISEFLKRLKELGVLERLKGNVRFKIEQLYEALLDLDDPQKLERAKEIIYEFHQNNVPIREIVLNLFLELVENYLKLIKERGYSSRDIKNLKILLQQLDRFLTLVDELFEKYMRQLSQKENQSGEYNRQEAKEIIHYLKGFIGKRLDLIKLFKGVFPVICKSELLKTSDLFTTFEKCPYKVFIPGERFYVKVPGEKGVLAEIVNVSDNSMVAKPLKFAEIPLPKRVTVFPDSEVDVKIETPEGVLYGFLHYLSYEEAGVLTTSEVPLEKGQKVKIEFTLPTGQVKTEGTIKEVEKRDGAYLVKVSLEPDFRTEQIISRYVLRRQQEILKELRI